MNIIVIYVDVIVSAVLRVLPYCRRFKIYTNEKLVSLGMTAMFISQLIISLIVLVLAIIILAGKGDNLIAGYNTATKNERETYNIRRVRICIGGMLVALSMLMLLFADNLVVLIVIVPPLSILSIVLANTWAKK